MNGRKPAAFLRVCLPLTAAVKRVPHEALGQPSNPRGCETAPKDALSAWAATLRVSGFSEPSWPEGSSICSRLRFPRHSSVIAVECPVSVEPYGRSRSRATFRNRHAISTKRHRFTPALTFANQLPNVRPRNRRSPSIAQAARWPARTRACRSLRCERSPRA